MERIQNIYNQKEDWGGKVDNAIFLGLQILNEYAEKEISINPGHDQIFAGLEESEYKGMSEEDIQKMFKLGWFIDEESFSIFT